MDMMPFVVLGRMGSRNWTAIGEPCLAPPPPIVILKTKDLPRDCAQSIANNLVIRKVLEIQELPPPAQPQSGSTGILIGCRRAELEPRSPLTGRRETPWSQWQGPEYPPPT